MLRVFAKASGSEAELLIYDDIGSGLFGGGVSAKQVADALKECAGAKTLNVRINSYGGDVFEGFAIYNAIKRFSGKKICSVDGIAASAASLICMAADTIQMSAAGFLMIHQASSFSAGSADDMRQTADRLDKINDSMTSIYAARSGQSTKSIKQMMADETWFSADDALAKGFADKILKDDEDDDEDRGGMWAVASASPLLKTYRNLPPALRARAVGLVPAAPAAIFTKENKVKKKVLLSALGLPITADASAALAAIKELRGYKAKYEALRAEHKTSGTKTASGRKPPETRADDVLTEEQVAAAAKAGWGEDKLKWIREAIAKNGSVSAQVL